MSSEDTLSVKLRPEIVAVPAYKQGRPAPADGYKLSSNENPYPPLPSVVQAVAATLGELNRCRRRRRRPARAAGGAARGQHRRGAPG
ncbi:hypothetical protein ACRAWC_23400 [Leifsonia sp. L25]|uniref:hypothetical protein n=1 Tax=Leifsonia sp. L25 TaxID=3423957 RepID=UPI003D68501B